MSVSENGEPIDFTVVKAEHEPWPRTTWCPTCTKSPGEPVRCPCLPSQLAEEADRLRRQRDGARARANWLEQQAEDFYQRLCNVLDPDDDELEPQDVVDLVAECKSERDEALRKVHAVERLLDTDAPPFLWKNNRGTQARFREALVSQSQS